MSILVFIVNRVLSSFPILFFVSIISFLIIRLNVSISSLNLSIPLFLFIAVCIFAIISKIKNQMFIFGASFLLLVLCSIFISQYHLLPFDLLFKASALSVVLNFLFIFMFFMLYFFKSYFSKSLQFPQIILLVALSCFGVIGANKMPISISVKEITIKTGDPLADLRLNPAISSKTIQNEEKRLGLDKPWYVQYLYWLRGIFHGDLGVTQQNQPVLKVIQRPIFNTLLLSLATLFCTWFIAIPLGIWAAINRNKFVDKLLGLITSCGMSTPSFILAIFGLLFALNTQIVPIGGLTSVGFFDMNFIEQIFDVGRHLILPTVVLTLISIASLQRQMRSNLLEVLEKEYIKTAIAKGLPSNKVIYKHALRNAINPLITIFGFEFASLLSGAALTETVLAYPGLGALTLEAARKMDINLIMTSLMIGSIMLITGNLISDILLRYADPRIKLEGA